MPIMPTLLETKETQVNITTAIKTQRYRGSIPPSIFTPVPASRTPSRIRGSAQLKHFPPRMQNGPRYSRYLGRELPCTDSELPFRAGSFRSVTASGPDGQPSKVSHKRGPGRNRKCEIKSLLSVFNNP